MNISELISILNRIMQKYGDCKIGVATEFFGNHIDDYDFLSSDYVFYLGPNVLILIPEVKK